jgi:hypothetical protein
MFINGTLVTVGLPVADSFVSVINADALLRGYYRCQCQWQIVFVCGFNCELWVVQQAETLFQFKRLNFGAALTTCGITATGIMHHRILDIASKHLVG